MTTDRELLEGAQDEPVATPLIDSIVEAHSLGSCDEENFVWLMNAPSYLAEAGRQLEAQLIASQQQLLERDAELRDVRNALRMSVEDLGFVIEYGNLPEAYLMRVTPTRDYVAKTLSTIPSSEGLDKLLREERERCAKVCDEYATDRWRVWKDGDLTTGVGRADCIIQAQSDGAEECSAAIRAMDSRE